MRNITDLLTKEKIFSQPLTNNNRVGGGVIAYNYIKSKRGEPHVIMTIATGGVLNSASRPELDLPLSTFTPLAMEAALKRVYESQAYKDYSHRNMFDNNYLDSAAFKKYLEVNRVVHEEFLRAIGVVK